MHNEKLHDWYSSSDVINTLQWRKIRQAEHVAYMGTTEMCSGVWQEDLKERERLEKAEPWCEADIKISGKEVD